MVCFLGYQYVGRAGDSSEWAGIGEGVVSEILFVPRSPPRFARLTVVMTMTVRCCVSGGLAIVGADIKRWCAAFVFLLEPGVGTDVCTRF